MAWTNDDGSFKWSNIAPIAGAGAFGAAAGLGGSQTTTGSQTSQGNTIGTGTSADRVLTTGTTSPNLAPEAQQLLSTLTDQYMKSSLPDLNGFRANNINAINQQNEANDIITRNSLAARGLNQSPAGAILPVQNQIARNNQITQFENNIPTMMDSLMQQHLTNAGNFFRSIPVGQRTTSDVQGQHSMDQETAQQSDSNSTSTTKTKSSLLGSILGVIGGIGGAVSKLGG